MCVCVPVSVRVPLDRLLTSDYRLYASLRHVTELARGITTQFITNNSTTDTWMSTIVFVNANIKRFCFIDVNRPNIYIYIYILYVCVRACMRAYAAHAQRTAGGGVYRQTHTRTHAYTDARKHSHTHTCEHTRTYGHCHRANVFDSTCRSTTDKPN